MPTSDAQRRACQRQRQNHDIFMLYMPMGNRANIKRAAAKRCMTMQRFVREAVNSYGGEMLIETENGY